MVLFLISFVAGAFTVLAPCVLPLLPVIVGGSLATGSRRRAYIICLSLGGSVILFTLLLKASTLFINVPQALWELLSGGILVLFGLMLVFPRSWDSLPFVNALSRASNKALAAGAKKNSVWGDVIMGAALGPVFSSCSPTYFVILATVLPVSFSAGIADLLAYAIGLAGFLFVIAIAGQRLVDRLGVTIEPNGWFRRAIGVLFLIVGLAVATGADAQTEAWLLNRGFDVTAVEQQLLQAREEASGAQGGICTSSTCISAHAATSTASGPAAPELTGIDGYINTGGRPITIRQFRGKDVVLVDFWTYSCINCVRTIPYVEAWYQKYKDEGLVVIGVSTPEFAFEHVESNVQMAVRRLGITYPVVLDNEYKTWDAFGNEYWPQEYLIDINGDIVHSHSGEGDYAATEAAIQNALVQRAMQLGLSVPNTATTTTPADSIPVNFSAIGSPETYFGSARNEFLGNGTPGETGAQMLQIPPSLAQNTLYLGGAWDFTDQYAQDRSAGAQIRYVYDAKNVYLVAAASGAPVKIKITRDGGQPLGDARGSDVDSNGEATISADRLYDLVQDPSYGTHTLEIEVEGAGLQAFTLTFG